MPLPPLIEIIPPTTPPRCSVSLPGSKSITNRALTLAALATQPVTLKGALWSEDTQIMTAALQRLGFHLQIQPDPHHPANRQIVVHGLGGQIPNAGTPSHPLEIFVGNAGTAARFLTAFLCLGHGTYHLDGVPRMRERPQTELLHALRQLGYRIDTPNDRLPLTLHASGPRNALASVSIKQSSQFASALLMTAPTAGWSIQITDHNSDEAPYVTLTSHLLRAFPHHGGCFDVEPDASSGSYFVAMRYLLQQRFGNQSQLHLPRWPHSGWQIDERFPSFLPLPHHLSRETDLGDSIMTAIVLAPLAPYPVEFSHLGRLRLQECERVHALRTELTRCGATVEESNDTLVVHPSALHASEIETYQDHRMALCFATLGLHVPGLQIKNPSCVTKTFPTFFQQLATPPPHGPGITLVNPLTGQTLKPASLAPQPA
jgi:3-phosphoshikimate 1-carboxyvinyltransferase